MKLHVTRIDSARACSPEDVESSPVLFPLSQSRALDVLQERLLEEVQIY